jgi:hypothetical protein
MNTIEKFQVQASPVEKIYYLTKIIENCTQHKNKKQQVKPVIVPAPVIFPSSPILINHLATLT